MNRPGPLLFFMTALLLPLGCRPDQGLPAGPEREEFALRRGRSLYQLRCAACHGSGGKGDGLGWPGKLPGRPADLATMNGRDMADLVGRITALRPDRRCPTWDKALTPSQLHDLARFIQAGLPAGGKP